MPVIAPTDVVEAVYAWEIEQWEGDATLLGLLARPDVPSGWGGLYREAIPPGATASERASLYPALVTQHESSRFFYALVGNGGQPIGWEWVGTFYAVTPGAYYSDLPAIVNAAGAALMQVNFRSDPLVASLRIEDGLSHADDDSIGMPYRWLGARIRVRGDYT